MYICNHQTLKLIEDYIYKWVNTNNKIQPLFINGNSGIGKTFSITSILNKYNIYYKNHDEYSNYNEIEYNMLNKDIISLLDNKKKSIIFDNFENETLNNNIYSNLLKLFKKNNMFNTLIIIISNNILKKKILNIKKYSTYFYLDLPTHNELFNFLKSKYNINNKIIENVIKKSKYNITKCILNLEIIKKNNNHNNINFIGKYENETDNIDIIKNIYFGKKYESIEENSLNYNFYHNLYDFIYHNKFGNNENKLKIIKICHNNLLYNNLIEKQIYINKHNILKYYHIIPIMYYQYLSKDYNKKLIKFNYTNYYSKYFILLNKNNIIEKLCIDNNIKYNKFHHNGLKLIYNLDIDNKQKINKYNLYSII